MSEPGNEQKSKKVNEHVDLFKGDVKKGKGNPALRAWALGLKKDNPSTENK